jgi:hypothetical protein
LDCRFGYRERPVAVQERAHEEHQANGGSRQPERRFQCET